MRREQRAPFLLIAVCLASTVLPSQAFIGDIANAVKNGVNAVAGGGLLQKGIDVVVNGIKHHFGSIHKCYVHYHGANDCIGKVLTGHVKLAIEKYLDYNCCVTMRDLDKVCVPRALKALSPAWPPTVRDRCDDLGVV